MGKDPMGGAMCSGYFHFFSEAEIVFENSYDGSRPIQLKEWIS